MEKYICQELPQQNLLSERCSCPAQYYNKCNIKYMMIGNILDSGGADKSYSYEETVEAEEIFSCAKKMCQRFSHLIQILLSNREHL